MPGHATTQTMPVQIGAGALLDGERLGHRVVAAIDRATGESDLSAPRVACLGASNTATPARIAAAERPNAVPAVTSRGRRPDLAGDALLQVQAPALFVVGGADDGVIDVNRQAIRCMQAPVSAEIVPGATHLCEEPGILEKVSRLAVVWCRPYPRRPRS